MNIILVIDQAGNSLDEALVFKVKVTGFITQCEHQHPESDPSG